MYVIDVGTSANRRQVTKVGFASQSEAESAAIHRWECTQESAYLYGMSPRYRRAAADILAEESVAFLMPDDGPGFVYFVRSSRYLKIGYSADAEQRLTQLRYRSTAGRLIVPSDLNERECSLWLCVLGSTEDEKALHRLARNYWVCGEWFWADDCLVRALTQLVGHRSLLAA